MIPTSKIYICFSPQTFHSRKIVLRAIWSGFPVAIDAKVLGDTPMSYEIISWDSFLCAFTSSLSMNLNPSQHLPGCLWDVFCVWRAVNVAGLQSLLSAKWCGGCKSLLNIIIKWLLVLYTYSLLLSFGGVTSLIVHVPLGISKWSRPCSGNPGVFKQCFLQHPVFSPELELRRGWRAVSLLLITRIE